jgi:hypothetical protein
MSIASPDEPPRFAFGLAGLEDRRAIGWQEQRWSGNLIESQTVQGGELGHPLHNRVGLIR